MFKNKTLLITGGTGSFGNAVLNRFLHTDIKEIRIFSRDEKKQDDMRHRLNNPKVKFYIGAYIAEMNGVDAIVFTAGVGENDINMRDVICSELGNLGIKLDLVKNKVRGKETIISRDDSNVKILLIPTNEELMIARDTFNIVKYGKVK